jgi:hypothetical protein
MAQEFLHCTTNFFTRYAAALSQAILLSSSKTWPQNSCKNAKLCQEDLPVLMRSMVYSARWVTWSSTALEPNH